MPELFQDTFAFATRSDPATLATSPSSLTPVDSSTSTSGPGLIPQPPRTPPPSMPSAWTPTAARPPLATVRLPPPGDAARTVLVTDSGASNPSPATGGVDPGYVAPAQTPRGVAAAPASGFPQWALVAGGIGAITLAVLWLRRRK